jgi:hypothetical protein
MGKVEFGGPEWTEFLRVTMQEALREAGPRAVDVSYSISERYVDPPSHLAPADGDLGWRARIVDGVLDFDRSPSHEVDIDIKADYRSILPLARLEFGDDPDKLAERDRLVAELVSAGHLVVRGDMSIRPDFMEGIHDALARVTA